MVTAHLQVFRDLPVRDTGFLQIKKLLDFTHVNDCSCHIPLPFLISAKLGDLTRWCPTMLPIVGAPPLQGIPFIADAGLGLVPCREQRFVE